MNVRYAPREIGELIALAPMQRIDDRTRTAITTAPCSDRARENRIAREQ